MTTLSQLIDEVSLKLSGYTMRQDTMTTLSTGINDTATSVVVANADGIGQGIIEIDDELMYVTAVDRASSTLTIAPWGRGYLGTTASAHDANARVTAAPSYPRHEMKNAINDTILAIGEDIFGLGTFSFTYNPAVITYEAPADAEAILTVTYEEVGPSKQWIPIRRFDLDRTMPTSAFASGKALTIGQQIQPGRTVQVSYIKEPTTLPSLSSVFETVTGMPSSAKDVVVLGAVYRILSMIEPGRVNYETPEAAYQQGRVPFGAGTNTAKYVFALFQQRLNEESKKLKTKYAVRVHFTR